MRGRLGGERGDVLGMVGDLQRDVCGAGERLTERKVVVVLLQLRDRCLVGLSVLARERYQALAEPLGLGGGARGFGPLVEVGRPGGELDERGSTCRAQRSNRASTRPTPLSDRVEQLAEP